MKFLLDFFFNANVANSAVVDTVFTISVINPAI